MNVASLLSRAALAHADRPAVRFGARRITYADLGEMAARMAGALRAAGLRPGDRVAIFMRNNPEYIISLFGAFHAGLCAVPVNARLHPRELAYILGNADCRALIFGEEKAPEVGESVGDADGLILVRVGDERPGVSFRRLLETADPSAAIAEVAPDDLAWLFYTSGTTGRPKGAMLTHRNLVAMTMNLLADVWSFQPEDVVLHVAPLSHGSGLYALGSLARGAENIIYDKPSFDPADALRVVQRERVNVIAFVAPTMIVTLLDTPSDIDTSSLQCVIYGGGPMHVDIMRQALTRFGKIFVQIYGQGEAPMTITYLSADAHDADNLDLLASCGVARTDVEVRVVDDRDRDMAVGAEGEVIARGDVVMKGYWRNRDATEKSLRGGWLHTGDIGRLDARGNLYLLDRKTDMIITGGSNVYPREVEEVLVLHDSAREAVVFGVSDPFWGERIVAEVVPRPGASLREDELIDFCKQHLASFKKPTQVRIVEELPKNAYGKVLRRELRAAYEAGGSGDSRAARSPSG